MQLTGVLVEDANDEGCSAVAEQTYCNPGKTISPQHSFMPDPSLENAWVNLASDPLHPGEYQVSLCGRTSRQATGAIPKQAIGDNIENGIEEAL